MKTLFSLLIILLTCMGTVLAQPEIHVNIPAYLLQLTEDGQVLKEYNIAVGTPYEPTPVGSFKVFLKEEYPVWFPGENFTDRTPVPPGPDNPLGTRWMEFKAHYGVHGTNKGWDINFPVSGGCIRMFDADAQELYEKAPIGTPVFIEYQTMFLIEKNDGLYLKVFPDIYDNKTNTIEHFGELYQAFAKKYPLLQDPLPLKSDLDTVYEVKISIPPKK